MRRGGDLGCERSRPAAQATEPPSRFRAEPPIHERTRVAGACGRGLARRPRQRRTQVRKDGWRAARPRRWLRYILPGAIGALASVAPALAGDRVEIASLQGTCDHTRPGRLFEAPAVD